MPAVADLKKFLKYQIEMEISADIKRRVQQKLRVLILIEARQ